MRYLLMSALFLKATFSFGQNKAVSDTIGQPVYDTTSVEIQIRSINSFYFGSKLYQIPKGCNVGIDSSCCTFETRISKSHYHQNTNDQSGNLNCYGNSGINWTYFDSLNIAKFNFESTLTQTKKQMKKFEQKWIKLFVCGKEVIACKVNYTTYQDNSFEQIMFYGNINDQNLLGYLWSTKSLNSSKNLSAFLQQIFKF